MSEGATDCQHGRGCHGAAVLDDHDRHRVWADDHVFQHCIIASGGGTSFCSAFAPFAILSSMSFPPIGDPFLFRFSHLLGHRRR